MAEHSLLDGSSPSNTLTLALLTPGVSPELAAAITQYVADLDAYRDSDPGPNDHLDYTNFRQARDFPARSAEDLAAKLALAMSELRGCSITPAEVVIDEEFCFDLPSEEMVLAALDDARRLASENHRIGTELAALIEAGRQASAAAADFYDNVCAPADDAAAAEIAAIPHVTTRSSYEEVEGVRQHLTTSSEFHASMARRWITLIDGGKFPDASPELIGTCRELVAALDDRSAQIDEINKKWRLAEQNARSDELGSAASVAEMAALKCPATSLAELLAKIEYAREIDVVLDQIADEIHADVRRLAGAEPQSGPGEDQLRPGRSFRNPRGTDTTIDTSIIRAIHARYESASIEMTTLDRAGTKLTRPVDESKATKVEKGLRASIREMDALRLAILYQVPRSDVEAMILSDHISIAYDMLHNGAYATDLEKKALGVAIDTLFAYMAGNVEQDHKALGPDFHYNASRVSRAVRLRTGKTEDIE